MFIQARKTNGWKERVKYENEKREREKRERKSGVSEVQRLERKCWQFSQNDFAGPLQH